jgi:hypothetical protein
MAAQAIEDIGRWLRANLGLAGTYCFACNPGGFFGSWYVGFMKDLTGSYAGGLYGLAPFGLVSAFVCAFFLHIPAGG